MNPKLTVGSNSIHTFDLFLAGQTFHSQQFLRKFHRHARRYMRYRYQLNVIDVLTAPELAEEDQILATPTLIKRTPAPELRIVGAPADWKEFFANIQGGEPFDLEEETPSGQNAPPEENSNSITPQLLSSLDQSSGNSIATTAEPPQNTGDDLGSLVSDIADGVLVLDGMGKILFVNPAAARLLRRPAKELTGLQFGSPVVRNDKLEIDLPGSKVPFPVAELNITRTMWNGQGAYVATMRDITRHKSATDHARERVQVRDKFLATLSHEMRNPLSAISNAAQIVSRSDVIDGGMLDQVSSVMLRQCTQLSRLLDDLLEVSRISQGKIEMQLQNISVATLLADAASSVGPLIESRNLTLHQKRAPAKMVVLADKVRLQQAIGNLLTNAAKYTEPGGEIWLSARENHGHAEISVRDNGTGIPPELAKDMFEPFVQGKHNHRSADGGLGIGLSLVRTLVEMHEGEVWAFSEGIGKGSEFTIDLPLVEGDVDSHTTTGEDNSQSGLRLVIVEDNDDVRAMLKRLLELDGYDVTVAEDGQAGLDAILRVLPDVALVDLGLPILDGRDVAKKVRQNADADGVFMVALTGFGNAGDRRSTQAAGFDAHLTKPVETSQLTQLLQSRAAQRGSESRP